MKNYWIAVVIFIAITGGTFMGISCAPKALSEGTIEISEVYDGGCSVIADIDGANAITFFEDPQFFTFPNTIPPGDHIMNFSTALDASCGSGCGFTNNGNAFNQPLTFYVGAGEVFEAYVSQGTACNNILVGTVQ